MDGLEEIAHELAAEFPKRFSSRREALSYAGLVGVLPLRGFCYTLGRGEQVVLPPILCPSSRLAWVAGD